MLAKILNPLFNVIKFHKRRVLLSLGMYVFFLYLFFPFNDLGDLVSGKVSELTGGQIFVGFDTLSLSVFPQPGLALGNVNVETPFTPRLTAKTLQVAPSVLGLLTFKPGVRLHAEELLGGDIDLSTRGSGKTSSGKTKQKVTMDLSKVNLGDLAKMGGLPIAMSGNLSGSLDSSIDIDFTEQPSATLDLTADKVVIPESNISTPFGPLNLPKLAINDIVLESKADKGTFDISKLTVGKPGGDLYASVVGKIDLKMIKSGTEIYPQMGGYDLIVHLQVNEAFKQKASLFLGFLQTYSNGNNSYGFKLAGSGMYGPPNITKVQ